MKTPTPPEVEKFLNDAAVYYAAVYYVAATAKREELAALHGCGDFPNRFPVSGGICQHWPHAEADKVCAHVRNAQESIENARKAWRKAGRHAHTFRSLLASRAF